VAPRGRVQQVDLPILHAGIRVRIEGENAVVFRGDENHIMTPAAMLKAGTQSGCV